MDRSTKRSRQTGYGLGGRRRCPKQWCDGYIELVTDWLGRAVELQCPKCVRYRERICADCPRQLPAGRTRRCPGCAERRSRLLERRGLEAMKAIRASRGEAARRWWAGRSSQERLHLIDTAPGPWPRHWSLTPEERQRRNRVMRDRLGEAGKERGRQKARAYHAAHRDELLAFKRKKYRARKDAGLIPPRQLSEKDKAREKAYRTRPEVKARRAARRREEWRSNPEVRQRKMERNRQYRREKAALRAAAREAQSGGHEGHTSADGSATRQER